MRLWPVTSWEVRGDADQRLCSCGLELALFPKAVLFICKARRAKLEDPGYPAGFKNQRRRGDAKLWHSPQAALGAQHF